MVSRNTKDFNQSFAIVKSWFISATDHYGLYIKKAPGRKAHPITAKTLTDEMIYKHIKGEVTIGSYLYNKNRLCERVCIDFDVDTKTKRTFIETGRKETFKLVKGKLYRKVEKTCKVLGAENINYVVEDSVGGFHIWIFFAEPIPVSLAFDFVHSIEKDKTIEKFPKTRELRGKGNFVRLPGRYHSCALGQKREWSKIRNKNEWYSLESPENWTYVTAVRKNSVEKVMKFVRDRRNNFPVKGNNKKDKPLNYTSKIRSLLEKHFGITITKERSFCCPFHSDQKPSGSIYEWNGKELFKCHSANCRMSGKPKSFAQLRRILYQQNVYRPDVKTVQQVVLGNETPKLTIAEIVSRFCKSRNLLYTQGDFWEFGNGVWRKKGKQVIKSDIQKFVGLDFSSKAKIENKYFLIKNYLTKENVLFDKNTDVICLQNGVLNIYTKEFVRHNPDLYLTKRLNFKYNKDIKCPVWMEFLASLDFSTRKIKRLQEWFGYCLSPERKIQKVLYLLGRQSNGKSVILDTLRNLLGDYASCCSLDKLINGRFDSSSLEGKRCNVSGDVEINNKQINAGDFKEFVTGTRQSTERKSIDRYEFVPEFKLAFSANGFLNVSNEDEAFWRRLDIFIFPKVFPENVRDNNLRAKIDGELSGVFNWAIEGLSRLINNGWKFSPCPEVENVDKRKINTVSQVTVHNFLTEFCERDVNKYVAVGELYDKYIEICQKRNSVPLSLSTFGKQIISKKINKARKVLSGKQVCVYLGIKIKK
ncbi:phage/plasmid primase, P4 family [Candidatus Uabimicrobium amorphum]|uniref:Primase n=1 Tax=Uabimicrobium amorphum TaxID=2596890 RepID=A0A5S9IS73_UABAM|nr:phage/plasmid primase, P4 family [Candidatus Uabimicrobium amorphum]BBM86636.1 primase [Candidatus Uabimicrobium amorphum]